MEVGGPITPQNIVLHMLESAEKWHAIAGMATGILRSKEREERERQQQGEE